MSGSLSSPLSSMSTSPAPPALSSSQVSFFPHSLLPPSLYPAAFLPPILRHHQHPADSGIVGPSHFLPSYSPLEFGSPGFGPGPGDLADMRHFINRSLSPPALTSSDPAANQCKMVEYRAKKIAAFIINGKTMLCLPQAFELFLKDLVGGLHTVYTKCKRLEITPIVCNVEQVRGLRGLRAILPGVNRCKLLSDQDFDELYKDCTTQRAAYGDVIKSIERKKQVQGLLVAEERSNEEKLETGKNMDVEEITAGNDEYKNEEMVEKTKRNSGKKRLRNFALTENDLDVTRANNNRTSKAKEGKRTDDSDESQDVDAGDRGDTEDPDDVNDDDATIHQTESNDCSMESVLGSIQEMVRHAARAVRQSASGQTELYRELQSEKTARTSLRRRLRQIRQSGATYLRQYKKEKRLRLKLEEDLVLEVKKSSYFEDAINNFQK